MIDVGNHFRVEYQMPNTRLDQKLKQRARTPTDYAQKILHIEIGNQWSVEDMRDFYAHLEDLYCFGVLLFEDPAVLRGPKFPVEVRGPEEDEAETFDTRYIAIRGWRKIRMVGYPRHASLSWLEFLNTMLLSRFVSVMSSVITNGASELTVRRVEYGSPGLQDIAGFGLIIGHIKDMVLRIIETRDQRYLKHLKEEDLKLENTRKFLQIAADFDLSVEELKFYASWINARQNTFIELVDTGKLRSISLLPSEDEPRG